MTQLQKKRITLQKELIFTKLQKKRKRKYAFWVKTFEPN